MNRERYISIAKAGPRAGRKSFALENVSIARLRVARARTAAEEALPEKFIR
jgi:hypothetical protein